TLLYAVRGINRLEAAVPQFSVCVTGVLGLVCLAAFLFLIDYAARLLRPVSLVKRVGDQALDVIETVYPEKAASEPAAVTALKDAGPLERTILHRGKSAVVLAADVSR